MHAQVVVGLDLGLLGAAPALSAVNGFGGKLTAEVAEEGAKSRRENAK